MFCQPVIAGQIIISHTINAFPVSHCPTLRFAFLIFKYFPFGGVQRDMLRMGRELVRLGNTVDIYTMSWEGELPETGINTHVLPARGLLNHKRYSNFIRHALSEITQARFDLVVGLNRMPGLDAYFAADSCFAERTQKQHGIFYRLSGRYRWFSACERAVFAPSAGCEILLLSAKEKVDFQHWYATPDARFHLLPPYLSAERMALHDKTQMRQHLRQTFGFGEHEYVLLAVGSGFRTKGLDRSIHAVAALPPDLRRKTRLLVVGQDNPKVFKRLAADLGLQERVHISAGRSDIPQLMQGADLLIHPARLELAGHVLLEAMASGLPVLVSDVCGYASHIEQAKAGKLIAVPFQQQELNAQLTEMLMSGMRDEWAANGLKYAQGIMAANDGSAEAKILLAIAKSKQQGREESADDLAL